MNTRIIIIIIILLLIGGIVFFVGKGNGVDRSPDGQNGQTIDTSDWVVYTSEEFDFSLRHPPSWEVAAHPDAMIEPKFNVYDPDSTEKEPPFIHHNDITGVSVFPHGVPTEGVFGETATSAIALSVTNTRVVDFVLEDGTPWATMVTFPDTERIPASWGEPGFLWAQVSERDITHTCMRDGEEVSQEACDPMFGDTIVRTGDISEGDRRITEEILKTFSFTEATTTR